MINLPPTIVFLKKLMIFDCSDNNLTFLPSDIGLLQNLEEFWGIGNKLTFLPQNMLNLQKLHNLKIDTTNLTHMSLELGIFLNQKTNTTIFDETFIKNLNYNLIKNILLFAESIKNEHTIIAVVFGNLLRHICEFI